MIAQAMLNTVAVGVPIFLAAALGAHYMRRHGGAERWMWVVALALSFAVPLVMMIWAPSAPAATEAPVQGVTATQASQSPLTLRPISAEAASTISSTAMATRVDFKPVLLGLWLLLSGALAVRWGVSSFRLARMRGSWTRATLDGTPVFVTDGVGPAVAGVVRPAILLPSWVHELPAQERRLVLLHESEHVRAGDPSLVALGRVARVVAPWHPIVWLITTRLGQAVELDCDRRVVRCEPDVAAYGATLLAISARTSRHFLTAAAFAESDVPLRRRILAMTISPRAVTKVGVAGTVAVGALLLGGATLVPAPGMSWLAALHASVPVEAVQRAPGALPPVRIVRDPGSSGMLVRLESGEFQLRDLAPVGRWFPFGGDGRAGFIPQPVVPRSEWGFTTPLPPDAHVQQLTTSPQVLNPTEVSEATTQAYPTRLREQGIGGTVGILFLVERAGVVQQRRIGQVSAYPELDSAALEVARVYRFSGASTEEGSVPVWVSHAIDFRPE